jgi:hypothetical protein
MSEQIESARASFDNATQQMALIARTLGWAPEAHKQLHETALFNAYGQAVDQLEQSPELAEYYRDVGRMVLVLSAAEQIEAASVAALHDYATAVLIDEEQLKALGAVEHDDRFRYQATHFLAFETLFPEPEPIDEVADMADETEMEMTSEEDSSEEVNALDILEHLEQQGFTEAELCVIEEALGLTPVRLELLRKTRWPLISMPPDEYAYFATQFPDLRFRTRKELEAVGVRNKWIESGTGKNRGSLLIYGPAADQEPELDPAAGLKSIGVTSIETSGGRRARVTPQPQKQSDAADLVEQAPEVKPAVFETIEPSARAMVFAAQLKSAVDSLLAEVEDNRINSLARKIAEAMDDKVSRLEARNALIKFVEAEDYLYGPSRIGMRTIVAEPYEQPAERRGKRKSSGAAAEAGAKELSAADMVPLSYVYDALLSAGHQNKGIQLKDGLRAMGIDDTDAKRLISRVVSVGALWRGKAWERSHSPHSTKKETTVIKFSSQQDWLDYKADPKKFLEKLLSKTLK